MYSRLNFMNRITGLLPESWMDVMMTGVSFIMTGVMIFIYPEILAYIMAVLLLWIGGMLIYISFKIRKLRREYIRLQNDEQIW